MLTAWTHIPVVTLSMGPSSPLALHQHQPVKDKHFYSGNARQKPVSFFHLSDEFIGGKLSLDDKDELFDGVLSTVDIQQAANHHRQTRWIHLRTTTHQPHLH